MKLALSTLIAYEWSLEKTLEMCIEHKIDAIEIRLGIHEWSKSDMSAGQWEDVGALIRQYGIRVSNLGTGIVIRDYNEAALEEIKRCGAIADKLGCKGLRIMLGNFRNRWSEEVPEVDHEGIIRWLKTADEIVGGQGKEIWIETHNEYASGRSLHELLKESDVCHCRILWDLMHTVEVGESMAETWSYVAGDLVHVHIKDGRPWEDFDKANWRYTRLGEGIVPIQEVTGLLSKAEYQGYYSLEWEEMWRDELKKEGIDKESVMIAFSEMMRSRDLLEEK